MRDLQTLVAHNPPQGVLVRGPAGLVINKLSYVGKVTVKAHRAGFRKDLATRLEESAEARIENRELQAHVGSAETLHPHFRHRNGQCYP